MGSQHSLTRGSKFSRVESGIEPDAPMRMYSVHKRDNISRGRRNQHSSRPHSFGQSFGGNSKIIYNETLKGCSFKIYYQEMKKKTVVLLDCGDKVFANGRQMYPFDERVSQQSNDSDSRSSCDSGDVDFTERSIVCSSKADDPTKNEQLTLDTIMSQVTETFQRAMYEEQQYTRKLEEENNNLCWNTLELEQLKNKLDETEQEKKLLEEEVQKMTGKLKFVNCELLKLKELVTARGKGLIEMNGDVLNIDSRKRRRRRKERVDTSKLEEVSTIDVIKKEIKPTKLEEKTKILSEQCKCASAVQTQPDTTSISFSCLSNLEILKSIYQSCFMVDMMLKIVLIVVARSLVGFVCVLKLIFKH